MAEPSSQPERSSSPHNELRDIFVGRERELGQLRTALDDSLAGRGRLVMLAGEPGIGKTRTAQELAVYAQEQGAYVLWGRSYQEQGAPPYWPWIEPLRSLVQSATSEQLQSKMGSGAADIAGILPELHGKLPNLETPRCATGHIGYR